MVWERRRILQAGAVVHQRMIIAQVWLYFISHVVNSLFTSAMLGCSRTSVSVVIVSIRDIPSFSLRNRRPLRYNSRSQSFRLDVLWISVNSRPRVTPRNIELLWGHRKWPDYKLQIECHAQDWQPVLTKNSGFILTFCLFQGMTTWSRMSQGTHAVSKNIEGPYTKVETVIGTEAHNIYYAYSEPDKM